MTSGQRYRFGSRNQARRNSRSMTQEVANRRAFLFGVAGLVVSAGSLRAQSATARASAFVNATGNKLVNVINSPGSPQERRQALAQIIDATVDVDGVAQFCLGRYWHQATPQQRQEYLAVFRDVLASSIGVRLGEYQGVRFTLGRAVPQGEDVKVDTTIVRPNNPPTNVQWVIGNAASDPRIVDMIAEGTSMRLTQRSDYASFLARNNQNIDALISAIRQQVQHNRASG